MKPGGTGTTPGDIIARDTVEINAESIVWPSNETGAGWQVNPTSEWDGFALADAWWIEKSLEELINAPPKYWDRSEPVNGCVSGVPYKVSSHSTLQDLQTAAGWINGSGNNEMIIEAVPVNVNDLSAGLVVEVTLNGVVRWQWNEGAPISSTGTGAHAGTDEYIYLQSHWGSGVKFTSATIEGIEQ